MFGALRGLFGPKKPTSGTARPRPRTSDDSTAFKAAEPRGTQTKARRVNLAKRFTIIAETGMGSMSKVYKALDNSNGRTICLKVQDAAKTTAALARSGNKDRPTEGEIGLKIVHPHVVRTFEWGLTNRGEYYLVMEYVDGVSLSFVRESRGLATAEKVELLAQAAEGLAAVHEAGFIHHDFGPKNLLVSRDDQVKLIDFGLTIPNTPEYRRPGNRTGTLNYMAPEVIRREPKDERLDIFSWGVTAFELLSGRLPYDAKSTDAIAVMRLRINTPAIPLARVAPHLPGALCELIDATLAKRPQDRWAKAATLAEALRAIPLEAPPRATSRSRKPG